MLKNRIIPIILIDGFSVLKTINFKTRRNLGSPITVLRTFETRNVDELIILDIDASRQTRTIDKFIINEITRECFMPLTIGGGISTCFHIEELLASGADKVCLNTSALRDTNFIKNAVKEFGSQCIVISVDVTNRQNTQIYNPLHVTNIKLEDHLRIMEDCEVGEFLICDVDKEGTMTGANFGLAKQISKKLSTPLIYAGGIGETYDCVRLIKDANVDAIGCSSIFHFTDITPEDCRNELINSGLPARSS
jgi:imidazole glycerol-phosphate synthase subunit HisF